MTKNGFFGVYLAGALSRGPPASAGQMTPDGLFATLDELCQRRIFREVLPDQYAFKHPLIGAVVRSSMSAAHRRLFQSRLFYADAAEAAKTHTIKADG